jgi:hypothetical protein
VVHLWATGLMIGGSSPGRGGEFFSSPPALEPTLVTRGSFPGDKRPGREAKHSPPSSSWVKE